MNATRCGLLCALLLGCSDPDWDEAFGGATFESEHYRYRYRDGDALACREVLGHLEAYGAALVALLGVPPNAWTRTSYYKYPDLSSLEVAGACSSSAQACATSDEIFASVPLSGHELVHNVMAKVTTTDVSRLLAEGLANALTCEPGALPTRASWDVRTFTSPPKEQDVVQAGRLVLGLLQTFEAREVMDMLDAIGGQTSPSATRERLLAGWGVDLDVVQEEASRQNLSACVPWYACTGPALSEGTTELQVGCHGFDPATLPTTPTPVSLRVSGAPLQILPCELDRAASPLARLSPYRAVGEWEYWLETPSHKHALWFEGAEDVWSERTAEITLENLDAAFADRCAPAPARVLGAGAQVAIVLSGEAKPLHFSLELTASAGLKLDWQKGGDFETFRVPDEPVEVSWCTSCTAGVAGDCQVFDRLHVESQSFTPAASGTLVLRPSSALARAAVLELTATYPP